MINKYDIRGGITIIYIDSPKYGMLEAKISTGKLDRVDEYSGKWVKSGNYVCGSRKDASGKIPTLHRWIKQPPQGMVVDHIDGDPFNNTDSNLRIATYSLNNRNRKDRKINGPNGVRGVYKARDKWSVRLTINGVAKSFGVYTDFEEAKRVSEEIQNKILRGESA